MSHQFYDFDLLQQGTSRIVETIKKIYPTSDLQSPVFSQAQPGFLRKQFQQDPPQNGCDLDTLIKQTEKLIAPGIMHWQSPKFFGFFPSTIAVTTCLADLFVSTFQTPGSIFSLSPSQTQLENLVLDWIAIGLGLPQNFTFKGKGGSIINVSATESLLVSVHAAKRRKMMEIDVVNNKQKMLKFVGYFSEFSFFMNERALILKEIFYIRKVPVHYSKELRNFVLDHEEFEKIVREDIEAGLIPFWYGATYGTTFSNASDLCQEVLDICQKNGIWINLDAAYLGPSLFCPQLRPDMDMFNKIDSVIINFSKSMLVGIQGSLFYIQNRAEFTQFFQPDLSFSILNQGQKYQGSIDFKNWSFGFSRRFNSLKFFYLLRFYGLKTLQDFIRGTIKKRNFVVEQIKGSGILKIFSEPKFGLVCFQLCDKNGEPHNELTKALGNKIKNIKQGFMSPSQFKGYYILRIAIGNNNSTIEVIERYLSKIIEVGKEIQESQDI